MAYELKPNTFSLFRNKEKTADTHPAAKGSGRVQCPHCGQTADYFFDAWTNLTKDGDKYQSGKLKPRNAVPVAAPAAPVGQGGDIDDSDLPF
jgi:hypothetical protein